MSIQKHLNMLAEEIGIRPCGSRQNAKAVEYAAGILRRAGFAVELQPFDCMLWTQGTATMTLDEQPLPAQPAPYAKSCDVEGEPVFVDTVDALRKADLRGKITVLHGALASQPLAAKNFAFWNPDGHKEIVSLLENGKPLAIIAVSPDERYTSPIEDGDFGVPCAVVCQSAFAALKQARHVRLALSCARTPARSHTVIATLGDQPRRVCLAAHLDSKYTTPGAIDDAGGVAVLLTLAQTLGGKELPFTLEITLFNSEETYANEGEMRYIERYLTNPGQYLWMGYVDGVGMREGRTAYSLYECPKRLSDAVRRLAPEYGVTDMEPWPMGDHTIYVMHGVPAVSLTSENIFNMPQHDASDVAGNVDIKKLEESVGFLAKLLLCDDQL